MDFMNESNKLVQNGLSRTPPVSTTNVHVNETDFFIYKLCFGEIFAYKYVTVEIKHKYRHACAHIFCISAVGHICVCLCVCLCV